MMYLGRAKDHAADTYRLLHLGTERVYTSRDVIWMNKVYGEYVGTDLPSLHDTVTLVPPTPTKASDNNEMIGDGGDVPVLKLGDTLEKPRIQLVTRASAQPDPPTRATTQQPDPSALSAKAYRALKQLESPTINPEATSMVEQLRAMQTSNQSTGREEENPDTAPTDSAAVALMPISAFGMIDRFGGDFDDLAADLAMAATEQPKEPLDYNKIDPAMYKEIFENPKSWDEAWNHPDPFQQKKWREAILNEFEKMEKCKVWRKFKRSDIPPGRRCVKHKWVLEIKRDGRFRARLVACGYSQVGGEDFTEVYSPVANDVTFRIVVMCIVMWKLESLVFDIETAFLHGDLEEMIFMDCPDGMEHEDDECLLLEKTIYGLVQSARRFFAKLREVLVDKMGFQQCRSDPCLFIRRDEFGVCIIICHVDDCLCCGTKEAIKRAVVEIQTHGLSVTVETELKDYLSCEIKFSKDKKKAWIGQPNMIKKILKVFGEEVKSLQKYRTPGTPGHGLVRPKAEEDKIPKEKHSRYRTGVGMLLYLIKQSRPEIGNAVRELTKCLDGATEAAYKEMLRVIKHVLDTPGRGLKVEPVESKKGLWRIVLFTDADWSGDKDDRKSISGYMLFLNGVLVAFRSKSQKIVALSSAESEFYSCSEGVRQIPFVVQLCIFLGVPVELPIDVLVDNMGAMFMTQNLTSSDRTCHMDTRWHYVNDFQEDGFIRVQFVRSEDNPSDLETKNVTGEIFEAHLPRISLERDSFE